MAKKLQNEQQLEIFNRIVSSLASLDKETRTKMLQAVATFLELNAPNSAKRLVQQAVPTAQAGGSTTNNFSNKPDLSPKQFLMMKEPRSDVERVACLAYYLTHFRDTPEFKTLDISKLNTEAAQPKFSNAHVPVENATQKSFLVSTSGGQKQLGALGEQFVQALPDREAAKEIVDRLRVRRFKRSKKSSKSTQSRRPNEIPRKKNRDL